MVSEIEFILLFKILVAHLLADFFFQPYSWIKGRRKFGVYSRHLYLHIGVVGLITYLLIGEWTEWRLPLFIVVTHFLIDWWKSSMRDSTLNFVIDQLAHLLMAVIGWLWYIESGSIFIDAVFQGLYGPTFWIILGGYLIALRPMGFLITKVTHKWQEELGKEQKDFSGLDRAGTWIGYLERIIILTFILLQQYSAIGFLIAAKSIFRFSGGVKEPHERKYAEYILIGTLISFSLAILLGIGMLALL
ncbi:MAG: DUF3307 domain-containing protein [Balneolaceae bacterium]|nr:DUF3307 domain-containing protein [Balneolaceae bacterium]